jgi:GcrA cell cycle regulator
VTSPWNEARKADVRRLFTEGKSASQIAAAMPFACTRNAVMGILHRTGLRRAGTGTDKFKARPRRLGQEAYAPVLHAPWSRTRVDEMAEAEARAIDARIAMVHEGLALIAKAAAEPPRGEPVSLLDLRPGLCRWIHGDPCELPVDAKMYCGEPTDGGSWCPHHLAVVTDTSLRLRRAA